MAIDEKDMLDQVEEFELDDSFTLDDNTDVESVFVSPTDASFPFAIWGKGLNNLVKGDKKQDAMARGFMLERGKCPQDFNDAMERAVKDKKAALITVRHENGQDVDYWQFNEDTRFYPLILGVPAKSKILVKNYQTGVFSAGENKGLVAGSRASLEKDQDGRFTNNYKQGDYVAMLVIAEPIASYYTDAKGLPKAIKIAWSSFAAGELYKNVLIRHAAMVAYAQKKKIFPTIGEVLPFMLAFQWNKEDEKKHGKVKGEQKEVTEVKSYTPTVGELTVDYVKGIAAPKELRDKMARLLFMQKRINGVLRIVAGGALLDWAQEMINSMVANQNDMNPGGDTLTYGKHDCPNWMIERFIKGNKDVQVSASTVQSDPKADLSRMAKEKAAWFKAHDRNDMVTAMYDLAISIENGSVKTDDAREFLKLAQEEQDKIAPPEASGFEPPF